MSEFYKLKYYVIEAFYEDDVYKGYCTWGRENMGISIAYQQEDQTD